MGPQNNFCIHGMNPKSCPSCYNLQPVVAATGQAAPSDAPTITDAQKQEHYKLLAAAKQRLEISQMEIARRAQETIAKARAEGKTIDTSGAVPYRSADVETGHHDETGLWIPAKHVDLIDRARSHPHAGTGNPIVLNPTPHVKKFD